MGLLVTPTCFFNCAPASGGGGLLLDSYEGDTTAARSTARLLLTSYNGNPLIRVRRSADNTQADIGHLENGNLDEDALLAWVGAGSGYITKIYDQTGNGNYLHQSISSKQPRIVNAGTIEKRNGVPVAVFDGIDDALLEFGLPLTTSQSENSSFVVYSIETLTTHRFIYGCGGLSAWYAPSWYNSTYTNSSKLFSDNGANGATPTADTALHSWIGAEDSTNQNHYYDGVNVRSNSNGRLGGAMGTWAVGAFNGNAQYLHGTVPEVICFDIELSAEQAASLNTNAQSFWGF